MKSHCILFFIAFIISSLSVQKISAQEKKVLMNRGILTEVKNIQKLFSDSVKRYDYKKDAALYHQKYRTFYGEKIKNLKSLYQSIYDKDVVIGKADPGISFKAVNGGQIENNVPQAGITPQKEVKNTSINIAEVENYQQLVDLKKQLTVDFPVYLIDDLTGEPYRCKLNFTIDVDGKFKKVQYSESSDKEFGIISALFLYAVGGLEKPLIYNKKPIVQTFSQPIIVVFK